MSELYAIDEHNLRRLYHLGFMECKDGRYNMPASGLARIDYEELGSGACEFELNTDMTAIRCDKCGYELPKGTDLKATRFCGGCGRRAR